MFNFKPKRIIKTRADFDGGSEWGLTENTTFVRWVTEGEIIEKFANLNAMDWGQTGFRIVSLKLNWSWLVLKAVFLTMTKPWNSQYCIHLLIFSESPFIKIVFKRNFVLVKRLHFSNWFKNRSHILVVIRGTNLQSVNCKCYF